MISPVELKTRIVSIADADKTAIGRSVLKLLEDCITGLAASVELNRSMMIENDLADDEAFDRLKDVSGVPCDPR